jgi:hypothetical protein
MNTVIPPGGLDFFRPAEVCLLLEPVPPPVDGQEPQFPRLTDQHLQQLWEKIGAGEAYPFLLLQDRDGAAFIGHRRDREGNPLPPLRGVVPMRRGGDRRTLGLQAVNIVGWRADLGQLQARLRDPRLTDGAREEIGTALSRAFANVMPLSRVVNDRVAGQDVFIGDAGTGIGYLVRAASPNWTGSVF